MAEVKKLAADRLSDELRDLLIVKIAKQGVRQAVTAKQLGIHQTEVSQLRRGVGSPSLTKLLTVAEKLGMRLEWKFAECEPFPLEPEHDSGVSPAPASMVDKDQEDALREVGL